MPIYSKFYCINFIYIGCNIYMLILLQILRNNLSICTVGNITKKHLS